jgi:hypothetical protein
VSRANEYVSHFQTRCEVSRDRKFLREDLSYKRVFPNPRYDEELEAAKAWDRRGFFLLNSMVVALNEFVAGVRSSVDAAYRLRNGVFAVHDSLGTRGDGITSTYWVPKGYEDPDESDDHD